MQTKPGMTNSAMRNGLYIGLLFSLNTILSATGNATLSALTNLVLVAIIVLVYRFTKNYRDKDLRGFISFRRAFAYVLLLFLFASIIAAATKFILFTYIKPDFLGEVFNETLSVLDEVMPSLPDQAFDVVDTLSEPINYSLLSIWGNMFYGVLLGIILGLVVRRKPGPFDTVPENLSENN